MLFSLRVGNVVTASDGGQAIDRLKLMDDNPVKAGMMSVGVIMSNWMMSPVDGLTLLKWLREDKASPDRFMPFVMVSGAADVDKITTARAAGVTEFLAKPYSITGLISRLLAVIDNPRQFASCSRRSTLGRIGGARDCPIRDPSDVSLATTTWRWSMTKTPPDDPNTPTRDAAPKMRYLRTRNRLREKAGGDTPGQPGKIPDELLRLASAELDKMAEQYPDFVADSIAALYAAHGKAAAASIEGRHVHFAELNVLAHEIKGQGGTFGYPLITTFGGLLFDFTSGGAARTDYHIEIVKAIIDAIRAVINNRIGGDGGQIGRDLQAALKGLIAKHLRAASSGDK